MLKEEIYKEVIRLASIPSPLSHSEITRKVARKFDEISTGDIIKLVNHVARHLPSVDMTKPNFNLPDITLIYPALNYKD